MSNLMAALFPEGRPSLVDAPAAGEVAALLAGMVADPRAADLMREQAAADDGFWPEPGHWMAYYRPYVVADGVLQIPVKGVLLANLSLAYGAYATGYVYIRRALERGLADPAVKGIALVCDSPGGEVAGNFDLVDAIYRARAVKPIRAFAHERAYSAAYSIASAAETITVSRTGGVGSIGVVTSHTDASAALEREGLKITFIYAGKHKVDGNATEPLPPEVKARWQVRIDELMTVFVDAVARNRAMDAEAVRATEALTYTASQALEAGLADAIGSLEDAVAAFAADLNTDPGDDSMSITQEAHDAALATARTDAEKAGSTAGATAAKTRIKAILACDEAKGRTAMAEHLAYDTEMTAEAAVALLAKAPKAAPPGGTRQDLASDMRREGAVDLGSDAETRSEEMSEAQKGAAAAKALLGVR